MEFSSYFIRRFHHSNFIIQNSLLHEREKISFYTYFALPIIKKLLS